MGAFFMFALTSEQNAVSLLGSNGEKPLDNHELKEKFLYARKRFEENPCSATARSLKIAAANASFNKAVSISALIYAEKIVKGY